MEKIPENGPKHIAIILDGNRRWAKKNGLPVSTGHKAGGDNLLKIIDYAYEIGLKYLTVYAFSTENWKREEKEVNAIMNLLYNLTKKEIKRKDKRNICIKVYGDKSILSSKIKKNLSILEENTKNRNGLTVGLCFNYGGRQEIVNSVKEIAKLIKENIIDIENIDEKLIEKYLYTSGIPDPDLVIRTSEEYRLSNFLPWQSTYSELYFPKDVYWPDFSTERLDEAIYEYINRNRRYGK